MAAALAMIFKCHGPDVASQLQQQAATDLYGLDASSAFLHALSNVDGECIYKSK